MVSFTRYVESARLRCRATCVRVAGPVASEQPATIVAEAARRIPAAAARIEINLLCRAQLSEGCVRGGARVNSHSKYSLRSRLGLGPVNRPASAAWSGRWPSRGFSRAHQGGPMGTITAVSYQTPDGDA